jgi:hypothetical protein
MAAKSPRLSFHCVSIVAGPEGCAAAQSLKDIRLLSAEAPRLPLDGCDHPDACPCIYRHFDDRRRGPRRATDSGGLADPWSATERRHFGRGRRATDL